MFPRLSLPVSNVNYVKKNKKRPERSFPTVGRAVSPYLPFPNRLYPFLVSLCHSQSPLYLSYPRFSRPNLFVILFNSLVWPVPPINILHVLCAYKSLLMSSHYSVIGLCIYAVI